jgi:hypothetical protein
MKKNILTVITIIALSACLITIVTATDPNTYTLVKTSPVSTVNLGNTVVMTAQTNNTSVNTVVFLWYAPGNYPSGPVALNYTDNTPSNGYTSSLTVNQLGEWTVVATFEKTEVSGGVLKPIWTNPIIRHVNVNGSFFVLPEYPLIGSAGIFAAMLLSLLVIKRKEISNQLKQH